MKIIIDKAGRVVISKQIRKRYHMQPGSDTITLDSAEFINREREYRNNQISDSFAAEAPEE